MTSTPHPYKKLPGKYKQLYTTKTLWQGVDHLLAVDSTLASEQYKRFYYKDIQALVLRKTHTGKIWNAVMGSLALLFGLPMVTSTMEVAVFFGAFGAAFLIILITNVLLGPTCKAHIQTAVQVEALPSLGRLRTAFRFLDRLRLLIEDAQGPLRVPAGSTTGKPVSH